MIESEITGAGEAGGEFESTAAEVLEFLVVVGAAGDFEDRAATATAGPEEIVLDADDEGEDDE